MDEANASSAGKPANEPTSASHEERKLEVSLQLSAELGTQLAGMTPAERQKWFVAIEQLLKAGATAVQVHDRVTAYRKRWPEISCTPWALVHHWSALAADITPMVALDRWIAEAPSLFDQQTALELLDDRPGLDDEARAKARRQLHAAYTEAAA